jgi:HPr kinase/phosphorylase
MTATVHGTAVAIDAYAVLLTGASGTGKSDLALRLIDRGAELIADDQVEAGSDLNLAAPDMLAGKIEIRSVGIVTLPTRRTAPLRLVVRLGDDGERIPASWPLTDFNGWSLPYLRINAFAASAPIKVEQALKSVVDAGLLPVRLSNG